MLKHTCNERGKKIGNTLIKDMWQCAIFFGMSSDKMAFFEVHCYTCILIFSYFSLNVKSFLVTTDFQENLIQEKKPGNR